MALTDNDPRRARTFERGEALTSLSSEVGAPDGPGLGGSGRRARHLAPIAILGATTSGKTKLAIEAAVARGGDVVGADKFYVFREFPVATGRADVLRADVATHLIGGRDAQAGALSVGEYGAALEATLDGLAANGRAAVIEGCSFGFGHVAARAVRARGGTVIGIAPRFEGLRARVERRLQEALRDDLEREAMEATRPDLLDTFVVQRSVVLRPLVDWLGGRASRQAALDRIVEGVLSAARSQHAKFLRLSGVRWIDPSSEALATVLAGNSLWPREARW
ncbi:MAG: hypothetical protein OHK0013_01920 [Sandaracinaceae bacterium]